MSGASGPVVFIVDDDDAVRDSLALLLGLRGYATRSFARGEDFLSAIDRRASGCILLDLRLPGIDGLAVQAEIAARGIGLPIIMLTAHGDAANARAALKAGAFDFLEKPIDDAVLRTAITAALARDHEARDRAGRRAAWQDKLARLTPREREVLELVVHGRHNREIAATLGISPRTVEVYKARVMDKLQVDRLPDLIRIALDLDLSSRHDTK
jgi:two-component system, LuxR family, response regulator FixJ